MINKEKNFIIVGIGSGEKRIYHYVMKKLLSMDCHIVALADNNSSRQGMIVEGYCVESVENAISNYKNTFIIIATIKEYEDLTEQMLQLNLTRTVDFEYAFLLKEIYNPNEYTYWKNILTKEEKGVYMDYPSILRIELSSYCNLQCIYCRYHSSYMKNLPNGCNVNLDFSMLKEIIEQVKEMGTIKQIVNVEKGEIFCNPQWFEMLKYIYDYSEITKFHFSTNGMLLDKKNVDKLLTLDFEELSITISIDGYSAEENDRLRKNAKYKIIEKNVKYLLGRINKNIKVQIQHAQFSTEQDIKKILKNIYINIDDNHYLRKSFGKELTVGTFVTMSTGNEEIDNAICQNEDVHIEYLKGAVRKEGCPLPINELTIDSEGYVCVCGCAPIGQLYRIENIKNRKLLDIWNGEIMKGIRNSYKNRECVEICKKCEAYVEEDSIMPIFVKNY